MAVLDNYFNGQADLPVVVAEIAAEIRNTVSPENPAAPIETESGEEVITPEAPVETPAPVVEDVPAVSTDASAQESSVNQDSQTI